MPERWRSWPAGSWAASFAALLRLKGLEPESIEYDAAYGWTVLLADGREFEAASTSAVKRRIEELAVADA